MIEAIRHFGRHLSDYRDDKKHQLLSEVSGEGRINRAQRIMTA